MHLECWQRPKHASTEPGLTQWMKGEPLHTVRAEGGFCSSSVMP